MAAMVRLELVTLFSLALLPLAVADAGAWYSTDGTIGVSAVTVSRGDTFLVDAAAGDEIVADLSWPSSQGSLFLAIGRVSATSCGIPGSPPECFVDLAVPFAEAIVETCERNALGGNSLSGGPQQAAMVASADGVYHVVVVGGIVLDHVDYHLHIQVDGTAPASVDEDRGWLTPAAAVGQHCPLL